jgi:hypothetical protein
MSNSVQTLSFFDLVKLSNSATELATQFCLAESYGKRGPSTRQLSRFVSRELGDTRVIELSLPLKGLLVDQYTILQKAYNSTVEIAKARAQKLSGSYTRLFISAPQVVDDTLRFKLDFSGFELNSLSDYRQLIDVLSDVANLLDMDLYNMEAFYTGIPMYTYRNLSSNRVDPYAVVGVDHLTGASGVLEWCTSEDDAHEVIMNMHCANMERFDVSVYTPRDFITDGLRAQAAQAA